MPLGAAHPTAPASAKRTKAAAAAGGQGGASKKEKKGKHKGWLAFPTAFLRRPGPYCGVGGGLEVRDRVGGLGEGT